MARALFVAAPVDYYYFDAEEGNLSKEAKATKEADPSSEVHVPSPLHSAQAVIPTTMVSAHSWAPQAVGSM